MVNLVGAALVIAFLYGVFRFGLWLYKDPVTVSEKLFYYDRYYKLGKVGTWYFRAVGRFFCWFPIFFFGQFIMTLPFKAVDSVLSSFLFPITALAWAVGSFFVTRAVFRRIDSASQTPQSQPLVPR